MNKLYNINGILHAKVLLGLSYPVTIHGTKYTKSNDIQYIPVDDVISLLISNYNIKVEIGEDMVKKPLYKFEYIVKNKLYTVVDISQHKKETVENDKVEESETDEMQNESNEDKTDQAQQFKKKDRKKFNNDQKDGE